MARILGVSRMAMSDRYRGRTPWSIDDLEVVSMALHIPVGELLARPGDVIVTSPVPVRPYMVGGPAGGGDYQVSGPGSYQDREQEPTHSHVAS